MHKNLSFSLRISSVNVTKFAGNCDLVTFTEEILNGKLHFLFLIDPGHDQGRSNRLRKLLCNRGAHEKLGKWKSDCLQESRWVGSKIKEYFFVWNSCLFLEAYWEILKKSKMENFATIVHSFQLLTIFAKFSMVSHALASFILGKLCYQFKIPDISFSIQVRYRFQLSVVRNCVNDWK